MQDKQPEALRLADALDEMSNIVDMGRKPDPKCQRRQAAALLRTQHEAIERKDALLRQALEALDAAGKYVQDASVTAAITKELSQ